MKAIARIIVADPTPREAELREKHHEMGQQVGQSNELIWRDDYENVPRLLREFIDQNPCLQPDHRQAIYQECEQEFLDIDQYARERTIRRPEVLHPK